MLDFLLDILVLGLHGEYQTCRQHIDQDLAEARQCPCKHRETPASLILLWPIVDIWFTLMIFGSAKTSLRICNFRLQGFKVSMIQSLFRVLICISDTRPTKDRAS